MLMLQQGVASRAKDWLRIHLRPRRFHAFVVGGPKTGTHSLAGIFRKYRAWHEPLPEYYKDLVVARAASNVSDAMVRNQIHHLDRRTWLELNSSWLNSFLLDVLVEEFPRAKFIFTIRDCYSWLDSMFNQLLGRPHDKYRGEFQRWFLKAFPPGKHQKGDSALAAHGLWPLDLWLRVWNQHCTDVLALVPSERLLIVRTQDIGRDIARFAEFLRIPPDTLDASHSHEYKAVANLRLLSEIDHDYLHACVAERCGDLMKNFFPDITVLSDVPGYRRENTSPRTMRENQSVVEYPSPLR